jgi:putative ABC transport system substrate-binding protein
MKRRAFIAGLGSAAAWSVASRAQQPAMPVVGFIGMRSPSNYSNQPFVRGLSETGFIDHRNVLIDLREAEHVDQLPAIGVELGRSKVSVICGPVNAIVAAKAVTSTIARYSLAPQTLWAPALSPASIGPVVT